LGARVLPRPEAPKKKKRSASTWAIIDSGFVCFDFCILKNVVKWKPKKIIFVDDNADYLKSVSYMCEENSIEFIGFQYLAEVFNQDKEINPEIAKIQIKILDEKQIWLQDNEVANYLKNNSRQ
jgi:hypothetical protein